ncbi:MAG TPA: EAL domain-containing protein, partial [Steroidobacteraceae bacterium]|nr:EAL domain-containing protein [Steroidobacteraceae bacterium]
MKSFRSRVLWLLLVLVVTIQLATVIVLVLQTNSRADQQAGEDLQVGARVLDALLKSRADELSAAVQVLVADYAFRQAVALNDADTLVSALDNQAERVDAQFAVLLDSHGRVLASTIPRLLKHPPTELQQLGFDAGDKPAVRYLMIGDTPYMLVSTSVRAPNPVATAVLAFAVDAQLAKRYSNLLRYQIGFVVGSPTELVIVGGVGGNANETLLQQIRAQDAGWSKPIIVHGNNESYMTWVAPIANAGPNVRAVLQKPLEDALAPYKSLRTFILLVAFFALLVALPFALHFAAQISRPLEQLARAARRIEAGDYTERVELDAPREFVAVASTLDSMQRNIAEREQRIRHQATHDELTSLPNRLLATQTMRDAIVNADAIGSTIALLVVELNDFDQLRSSFGFSVGDAVMVEVARRLGSFTGRRDTIACVANAEFLLLAPGLGLDGAEIKARQLLQSVRSGFISDGLQISLDAHVGIALYPLHGTHEVELQRCADTALFDAKDRNVGVAVYEPARDEQRRKQLALLGDLRRAINADELSLHYQPKVDMRSHAVRSLEALVRWQHPEHGRIPPDEFVPLAERTGNLALLTSWVLKKTLWQLREWRAIGFEPDVSVNLSATDLADPELANFVLTQLQSFNIS